MMTDRRKARARLGALVITCADWGENGRRLRFAGRKEARARIAEMEERIQSEITNIKQVIPASRYDANGEVEDAKGFWQRMRTAWSQLAAVGIGSWCTR
jgi:hypothetical protein